MQSKTAYLLSKFGSDSNEVKRLSDQAHLFLEFEFDKLEKCLPQKGSAADVGCGTGEISRLMAAGRPELAVSGLDADSASLDESRKGSPELGNLSFRRWKIGQAPPPQAPFDLIFTRLVLLHLPDPSAALGSLTACLKPGGTLYVVDCDDRDMAFEPRDTWQDLLLERMQFHQSAMGGTRQLGRELPALFEKAGLQDLACEKMYYSKRELGAGRFTSLFLPVALYYLNMERAAGGEPRLLEESIRRHMESEKTEMKICLWHCRGCKP